MERFIPTEISPEKSNTFQGITLFLVSPLRPKIFFTKNQAPARERETSLVKTWRVLQTATKMLFKQVIHLKRETCCFSSTLLPDFLAHNCEITGKTDECF